MSTGRRRPGLTRVGLLACALVMTLGGCATPRQMALQAVADQIAGGSWGQTHDLEWVRDSAPALLTLSESVLERVPDHRLLASTVAAGYTQYAYAFVSFEADRLQSSDARGAQALRRRAAHLYRRARDHAWRALDLAHPGWTEGVDRRSLDTAGWASADRVLAYWLAASWAAGIAHATDEPETVAELPRVLALTQALHARDPRLLDGALASLLASLEAARPGGSAASAERHFAQALAAAGDKPAAVLVAMAESLALPAGDRARFESLLGRALSGSAAHPDLTTQVMQRRARWLLHTADDRF